MRQWEEIAYARIDGHDEGLIEGRAEGRAEGLIEGQMIMLISQIRGNLSRGYTENQIADMLMQDIKDVQRISDCLKMYPNLSDSEIYEHLQSKQV